MPQDAQGFVGLVCALLSMSAEQVMDMQSLASLVGLVCASLSMRAEQVADM